jgi:hypothetical protein
MGAWTCLQREIYEQTRRAVGRNPCPSVIIMDGQSVKTTERGGVRGFDGHKQVKGRKRHILVDILGLPIASRVEPANMSDRRAGHRLLAGLSAAQLEACLKSLREGDTFVVWRLGRVTRYPSPDREAKEGIDACRHLLPGGTLPRECR